MNQAIFNEIKRELEAIDMELSIAGPAQVPEGLSRERIETWADDGCLYLYLPAGAQMIDGLWHAARAVGRLRGFPPDIDDIRAQALLDSWAYEVARSTTGDRRALLQIGRIRRRLGREKLDGEARVRAAFAAWSCLTVLSNRERDVFLEWLEGAEPGTSICLEQIIKSWGLSSPASPEDARQILEEAVIIRQS